MSAIFLVCLIVCCTYNFFTQWYRNRYFPVLNLIAKMTIATTHVIILLLITISFLFPVQKSLKI